MPDLQLPDDANVVEHADVAVAEALIPHRRNRLVRLLGAASDLSDQEPIYAGGAAVIAVGVAFRDWKIVHGGTRLLAAHLLATALRGIVKRTVDRTRPDAAAEEGYRLEPGESRESDYSSFPSGHTAGAVAVSMAAARVWPATRHVGAGLTVAAAGTQVLRSKHYLSDIVVGAAIGFAAEAAVNMLVRRAERV